MIVIFCWNLVSKKIRIFSLLILERYLILYKIDIIDQQFHITSLGLVMISMDTLMVNFISSYKVHRNALSK